MITVGFWCQTIHKKFLRRFDTIFDLKMMVKSGLENFILKFNNGLQSCCCPERLYSPPREETGSLQLANTVKLGNKERFDKELIGIKEPFPVTNLPFTS